jgi:tripartite-type tricarboxylate transporter receptor subunit TctC
MGWGKGDILRVVTTIGCYRVRLTRLLCLLVCGPFALAAAAQGPIDRPARIIVPLAVGSTSDAVARLIADHVRAATGQPVIVENKPGGHGRIAVEALKQAAPDGTALLLAPMAFSVVIPLAAKRLDYNPAKDFTPVAQVAEFAIALAVRAEHPARTLPEFVAWARSHPAHATFGTPGPGGLPNLFGVMIGRATGLDLVHVPYKGGAPLVAALMGGEVASGLSALSDFTALHRAGRIRILATSGTRRSSLAPEVATFDEQGFAGIAGTGWTALFAPTATPRAVIDRWSSTVMTALQTPELREKLVRVGLEPTGTTPEALAAIIAADTARWAPIIKASGFTLE